MNPFWKCQKGNIAVFFSLTILPVLGAAGVAVDYARAYNTKSFLQTQADRAALFAIQGGEGSSVAYSENFQEAMRTRYGDVDWVNNMDIKGTWTSMNDFRVEARAEVPVSLLAAVPGMREYVPVSVTSSVLLVEPRWVYSAPTVSELDYEAGDYNQVSVYCFDHERYAAGEVTREEARSNPIPIADNGDNSEYEFTMPRCAPGQVMSFKLLNVRLVRHDKKRWHSPSEDRFEYYTDTVLHDDGSEKYDIQCEGTKYCNSLKAGKEWEVLETVLCNSEAECDPDSSHSKIPEGTHRNPERATGACEHGKYMYYGWEDRPPHLNETSKDWTHIGWTDRDYDDIRIVIGCPRLEQEGERAVRLTQ